MAMFMAIEKFLAKHLDGRYQEGGTPEVQKRLAEITVDPASVTLAKKADASSIQTLMPAAPLTPGIYRYQAKISTGGQEIALKMTTTIKEQDGAYLATDLLETPMGNFTDEAVLDKATLELRKRSVRQGPAAIDIVYTNSKASGKMSMNGQDSPIDATLGGGLFADAAAAQQSVGALPLAAGYTATYRNFDLQKRKEKLMQLKVVGAESVTVPAGTFDCYKVELGSAEGGPEKATLWIAKDSRKSIKMTSVMPSMNGATMVSELLP